jgi:hypothetical protein
MALVDLRAGAARALRAAARGGDLPGESTIGYRVAAQQHPSSTSRHAQRTRQQYAHSPRKAAPQQHAAGVKDKFINAQNDAIILMYKETKMRGVPLMQNWFRSSSGPPENGWTTAKWKRFHPNLQTYVSPIKKNSV